MRGRAPAAARPLQAPRRRLFPPPRRVLLAADWSRTRGRSRSARQAPAGEGEREADSGEYRAKNARNEGEAPNQNKAGKGGGVGLAGIVQASNVLPAIVGRRVALLAGRNSIDLPSAVLNRTSGANIELWVSRS